MYSNQDRQIVSFETWMAALASSACIGFTSLVPWLFNMTFFERHKRQQGQTDGRMKFLLSFAVGAILGDIFFHLIPESLHSHLIELHDSRLNAHRKIGLSIIAGIFMFIIVEMILEKWSNSNDKEIKVSTGGYVMHHRQENDLEVNDQISNSKNQDLKQTIGSGKNHDNSEKIDNNNSLMTDLNAIYFDNQNNNLIPPIDRSNNNIISSVPQHIRYKMTELNLSDVNRKKSLLLSKELVGRKTVDNENDPKDQNPTGCRIIDASGYLNLIANGFDNFTHGLAIGASFLVGPKVGLLTTFVIFIHEIPHEICDYAILVNSGFSRWDAVKAQSSVSLFGILGTATALYVKSVQTLNAKTVWILPFSAGGFLYIALVNLLPEILDQRANFKNSLGQVVCVILGIAFMAAVAVM